MVDRHPGWGDNSPYGFFGTWFLCSAPFNHHWFCRPGLDRAIRRAHALQATDPAAANVAWAHIDHQLVDQAAWIPLVNPNGFEFVSARVRNFQIGGSGPLLDQLWLQRGPGPATS